MRKIGKTLPTVVQLTKDGDKYSLNSKILVLKHSQVFTPGEEVPVDKTLDGRKIINIFTIEGNKLIEKQIELDNARTMTITREFFDQELIVETTYGGVRINYLFMCILIFFKNIF
jgi:hypothetical protein